MAFSSWKIQAWNLFYQRGEKAAANAMNRLPVYHPVLKNAYEFLGDLPNMAHSLSQYIIECKQVKNKTLLNILILSSHVNTFCKGKWHVNLCVSRTKLQFSAPSESMWYSSTMIPPKPISDNSYHQAEFLLIVIA